MGPPWGPRAPRRQICGDSAAVLDGMLLPHNRRIQWAEAEEWCLVHLAALYAATFHNAGWRFWRVGVVLGLVALWRRYKESALQGARSLLVRWGEQLLEPDRMVGQDPLNSAPPDGDDELRALVGDIARTLARDAREWATDAAMDLRCSARRLYFCAADGLDALRGYRPIRLERRL